MIDHNEMLRLLEEQRALGETGPMIEGDDNMTLEDLIALQDILKLVEGGEPADMVPEMEVSVIEAGSSPEEMPEMIQDIMEAVTGTGSEVKKNDPLRLAEEAERAARKQDMYGNDVPDDVLDDSPLGTAALVQESRPIPRSTPATLVKKVMK